MSLFFKGHGPFFYAPPGFPFSFSYLFAALLAVLTGSPDTYPIR